MLYWLYVRDCNKSLIEMSVVSGQSCKSKFPGEEDVTDVLKGYYFTHVF